MILLDTTRLRQGLYRLAGAGFLPPDGDRVGHIGPSVALLAEHGLDSFAFAPAWHQLEEVAEEAQLGSLQASYVATFEAGVGSSSCPPVESAFMADPDPGSAAALQADLRRTYLRFGLRPATLLTDTVDHVAVELEAMAALCSSEAEAYQGGDLGRADRALTLQHSFLEEHLASWFPAFNQKLQPSVTAHPFYRTLGRAVHAFIHHDRELLATVLEPKP